MNGEEEMFKFQGNERTTPVVVVVVVVAVPSSVSCYYSTLALLALAYSAKPIAKEGSIATSNFLQ